ncbi:hypothetical protein DA2_1746 [Desulfovibrio sp. A2]|nr:hypothetical protein DA2_1746 [Desulfovibrio sp. A2]
MQIWATLAKTGQSQSSPAPWLLPSNNPSHLALLASSSPTGFHRCPAVAFHGGGLRDEDGA